MRSRLVERDEEYTASGVGGLSRKHMLGVQLDCVSRSRQMKIMQEV